jgi:hypothetical protein
MEFQGKNIEISEFNGQFVATVVIMGLDENGQVAEIDRCASGETKEAAIQKLLANLTKSEEWHRLNRATQ